MSRPKPDITDTTAVTKQIHEASLIRRLRQGDSVAFETIVRSHWHRTLRYAQVLLTDTDAASDVAQETFTRFWQARRTLNPAFPPSTWLLQTARNLAISERRKQWVRLRWARRQEHESHPPPTFADPLRNLEKEETAAALQAALRRLSPRRREVFELYHLQELSYREVADIMGIRPQTVANYLQAALHDLRVMLRATFPDLLPPS